MFKNNENEEDENTSLSTLISTGIPKTPPQIQPKQNSFNRQNGFHHNFNQQPFASFTLPSHNLFNTPNIPQPRFPTQLPSASQLTNTSNLFNNNFNKLESFLPENFLKNQYALASIPYQYTQLPQLNSHVPLQPLSRIASSHCNNTIDKSFKAPAIAPTTSSTAVKSSISIDNDTLNDDTFTPCDVCNTYSSSENDLMVYCDICDVPVHQHCYGIVVIPENEQFCDSCAFQFDKEANRLRLSGKTIDTKSIIARAKELNEPSPLCVLCSVNRDFNRHINRSFDKNVDSNRNFNRESDQNTECSNLLNRHVFKRLEDGSQAHMVCILYIPELQFKDQDRLRCISLKNLRRVRQKYTCIFCKIKCGACIQCSSKRCTASFHVMCARLSKLPLSFHYNRNKQQVTFALCPKHSKPRSNVSLNSSKNSRRRIRRAFIPPAPSQPSSCSSASNSTEDEYSDSSGKKGGSKARANSSVKKRKVGMDGQVRQSQSRKSLFNTEWFFTINLDIYPNNTDFKIDQSFHLLTQSPDTPNDSNRQQLTSTTDLRSKLAYDCHSEIVKAQDVSICGTPQSNNERRLNRKAVGYSCLTNPSGEQMVTANQSMWEFKISQFCMSIKFMVTRKRNGSRVSQRRKRSGSLLASHLLDLAVSKRHVQWILVCSESGYPEAFQKSLGFSPISRRDRASFSVVNEADLNPFRDTVLMLVTRQQLFDRVGYSATRHAQLEQRYKHRHTHRTIKFIDKVFKQCNNSAEINEHENKSRIDAKRICVHKCRLPMF